MKKYVRTKDKVYRVSDNLTEENIKIAMGDNCLKVSDIIPELCDGFVYRNRLYNKFIGKVKGWNGKYCIKLENEYDFEKDNINVDLTNCEKISGAIWTEWGLKYVAKMKYILPNGEIDWELLCD